MTNMKIICFVDRGNILRSLVAAALFNQQIATHKLSEQYRAVSFRTQGYAPDDLEPNMYPNLTYYKVPYSLVRNWLEDHNIVIKETYYSTAINPWFAEKAHAIIAVDRRTEQSLRTMFPYSENKICLLSSDGDDIIDPADIRSQDQMEQVVNFIESTIISRFHDLIAFAEKECNEGDRLVR
jgi:protein-tyrosine-phosphatase